MQDLISDARDYLSRTFGVDLESVPEDAVVDCVDQLYAGGWRAYKADFERFTRPVQRDISAHLTPIQQFAKMRARVGGSALTFRLKLHEEVVSVTVTEDEAVAVIRTCTVETRRSRDKITQVGLKRITYWRGDYEMPGGGTIKVWTTRPRVETVAVDTNDDVLTWGSAWTAERVAELEWQEENCFRPGTDRFPMDNSIRQAELSHKDVFGKVTRPVDPTA